MQVLIKEPSEHSHAPDPDRLHVIRLKNEIKLRGASSDEGYTSIIDDFDDEDYALLDYFERVWVGQTKGRGLCHFRLMCLIYLIFYNANLGNKRGKPKFSLQLWNIYERVIQDLPRSNNSVEGWHHAFNNHV